MGFWPVLIVVSVHPDVYKANIFALQSGYDISKWLYQYMCFLYEFVFTKHRE